MSVEQDLETYLAAGDCNAIAQLMSDSIIDYCMDGRDAAELYKPALAIMRIALERPQVRESGCSVALFAVLTGVWPGIPSDEQHRLLERLEEYYPTFADLGSMAWISTIYEDMFSPIEAAERLASLAKRSNVAGKATLLLPLSCLADQASDAAVTEIVRRVIADMTHDEDPELAEEAQLYLKNIR